MSFIPLDVFKDTGNSTDTSVIFAYLTLKDLQDFDKKIIKDAVISNQSDNLVVTVQGIALEFEASYTDRTVLVHSDQNYRINDANLTGEELHLAITKND